MPSNPLNDPLFQPTLLRIAGLLLLATALILTVERKNLSRWRESVLFQRVSSWAMMAPVFAASVFARGAVSLALVGFMTIQGVREFGQLVKLQPAYRRALMGYGLFALLVTAWWGHRFFLFMPIGFFAVATLVPLFRLSRHGGDARPELMQAAAAVLGYMWIPLFLSFFVLIGRTEKHAVAILLLIGFSVALSDIIAFTMGKLLKGPKISPAVSPNKTYAGLAGNLIGAFAGFALMGFAIPSEFSTATRWTLPVFIGLGAAWGDLVESLVKRGFLVKDSGDMLPGFGGLLDRIDSLLVVMPFAYYAMKVMQHYTA